MGKVGYLEEIEVVTFRNDFRKNTAIRIFVPKGSEVHFIYSGAIETNSGCVFEVGIMQEMTTDFSTQCCQKICAASQGYLPSSNFLFFF
jgi:hypothetical protein